MSSSPPLHTSFDEGLKLNNEMHKRSCPFDEDLTPQLKIHVGPNEAADGDEKKKEMGRIYERTIQLLKNGTRKAENSNTNQSNYGKNIGYPFEPPRFKQMIMNDKLQLEISKKVILPLDNKTCTKCGQLSVVDRSSCFQCIDFYCSNCLTECSKCREQFCPKCTLTIYDGGEHIECLACYR